ncbi:acyl-CoA N-acyltransferase [Gamsiella multidivaricata]|uniref:acyl-CoA N-acyltransferase n=1 Tax=Gamsiella multidivaricata TaxID=101098 RepID=UPI00221EA6CA|nr:acyl-CoA N-acyltransferase [Gamsiella multidivaricata]KAG0358386.1 hypothetical protein BGZ54_010448 [Gamsiella multidivaricata]KAI7816511.1 acyl-CoA N-acyltransferase [Gamsiella multidivaricata]
MSTEQEKEHKFDRETATAMGPYLVSEDPPHYLSAVDLSDIPEMVRVLNINKDIYNGTATFQYPYLESHAHARISRAVDYTTQRGYNTHWAMRTSPDGPLIGWVHAYILPDPQEVHPETGRELKVAEIGYWVSPEYVGKGYAVRSAKFVTHEILFKEFGCDIVRAEAYVENRSSRKIMEATGMRCEVEATTAFIPKLQQHRIVCCYAVHRDQSTYSVVSKGHS